MLRGTLSSSRSQNRCHSAGKCCSFVVNPLGDFPGREDFEAVEASTLAAVEHLLTVPSAVLVRGFESLVRTRRIDPHLVPVVFAVRLRQQVHRMNHLDVEAALSDAGHELEQAAGVADRDGVCA